MSSIAYLEKVESALDIYSKLFNISSDLVIEARLLIEKSIRYNLIIGYRPEEVAATSLYIICRVHRVPITFRDVITATNTQRGKIRSLYRRLLTAMNIKIPMPRPEDYITKRITPTLGLSNEITGRALELLDKLKTKYVLVGKNPSAIAAATVYIASVSMNKPVEISRLAKAAGVTAITIRNVARSLMRVLGESLSI